MWMDDVLAVLDAVGSSRPVLFGAGAGGVVSMLFAATYPERLRSLIVFNSTARAQHSADYEFGIPPMMIEMQRRIVEHWGTMQYAETILPVLAPDDASDERLRAWLARFARSAFSPGMAAAAQRLLFGIDIRQALPAIHTPTLVLQRAEVSAPLRVEHGRYLAEHLPHAIYKELPGGGFAFWAGDSRAITDEIEEFVTGARSATPRDRVMATVLFTDIVDSTATAAKLGDGRWKELLRQHDDIIRREIAQHRGRQTHGTGDGVVATFDAPTRALLCARAIRDAVGEIQLQIRAGLHAGEMELQGKDITGIAVHIGARVLATARPGEILVSRTVVDLVAGSTLRFEDRGNHLFKGVPGEWRLFSLVA
jgi:class 3 adenylate cyclase